MAADQGVRAVVVWGGERLFAAGADIKAMAEWGPAEIDPDVSPLERACRDLEAVPKPVIAAINGYALGGGLEVALAADFRFAAENATLGLPEIRLGIIPGAGRSQRLPRLVGLSRARELIYSGRHVGAGEALAIGLVYGVSWLDKPTIPPAIIIGLITAAGPFFIIQPAFGFGIASSKLPHPNLLRLKSIGTHLIYGIGLYVSTILLNEIL